MHSQLTTRVVWTAERLDRTAHQSVRGNHAAQNPPPRCDGFMFLVSAALRSCRSNVHHARRYLVAREARSRENASTIVLRNTAMPIYIVFAGTRILITFPIIFA